MYIFARRRMVWENGGSRSRDRLAFCQVLLSQVQCRDHATATRKLECCWIWPHRARTRSVSDICLDEPQRRFFPISPWSGLCCSDRFHLFFFIYYHHRLKSYAAGMVGPHFALKSLQALLVWELDVSYCEEWEA